jgi:hypothetical protein
LQRCLKALDSDELSSECRSVQILPSSIHSPQRRKTKYVQIMRILYMTLHCPILGHARDLRGVPGSYLGDRKVGDVAWSAQYFCSRMSHLTYGSYTQTVSGFQFVTRTHRRMSNFFPSRRRQFSTYFCTMAPLFLLIVTHQKSERGKLNHNVIEHIFNRTIDRFCDDLTRQELKVPASGSCAWQGTQFILTYLFHFKSFVGCLGVGSVT